MIGVEFVASEDFANDIELLKELRRHIKYDYLIIPDNPLGMPTASSLLCAKMIQDLLHVRVYPCLGGKGKSAENIISWLKGARYANLEGIACVSGDAQGWGLSVEEILQKAHGFQEIITTARDWERKKSLGATMAITQPVFSAPFLPLQENVIASFMPIFSPKTFNLIQEKKLGFQIPCEYKNCSNLMQYNKMLWNEFCKTSFYLIPLNLRKQLDFFKELVR